MPIEQIAPELSRIVATDQAIEELAAGYGGANGPAEGPVWWKEGGYLLFSDIHNSRRIKWSHGSGSCRDGPRWQAGWQASRPGSQRSTQVRARQERLNALPRPVRPE